MYSDKSIVQKQKYLLHIEKFLHTLHQCGIHCISKINYFHHVPLFSLSNFGYILASNKSQGNLRSFTGLALSRPLWDLSGTESDLENTSERFLWDRPYMWDTHYLNFPPLPWGGIFFQKISCFLSACHFFCRILGNITLFNVDENLELS